MFEVSPLSRVHIYAVDHATDSLLCQQCSDQNDATLQSVLFFQMVDVTDLDAADSFLQNAPNRIVHQIGSGLFSGQSSGLMKSGVSADSSATVSQARWVGWGYCPAVR